MSSRMVVLKLKRLSDPASRQGMARFGINTEQALGVSIPQLRRLAKEIGRDHRLAAQLWKTGIHEARILASMVDNPAEVSARQMESWVQDFDSWDVCDQCCSNLFDKTGSAYQKAVEWSGRKEEFVKRAGFALMATLAVHDKQAPDQRFKAFLAIIKRESTDDRNFVKKAINWALRQIGKRSVLLNREAVQAAGFISGVDGQAAKWIARDALKELTSDNIQKKLKSSSRSQKVGG